MPRDSMPESPHAERRFRFCHATGINAGMHKVGSWASACPCRRASSRTTSSRRRWRRRTSGSSSAPASRSAAGSSPARPARGLATKASREAIERAGLEPKDIDLLIYATLSPDSTSRAPACSCSASSACADIPCLDIRQQCTGFIYGLSIADAYIRTGQRKHVLVIGREIHSTGLDVSTAGATSP